MHGIVSLYFIQLCRFRGPELLTRYVYLQVVQEFGIPNLFELPIRPTVSSF